MATPYDYIQIVRDDGWGLVGIVPPGSSEHRSKIIHNDPDETGSNLTKNSSSQDKKLNLYPGADDNSSLSDTVSFSNNQELSKEEFFFKESIQSPENPQLHPVTRRSPIEHRTLPIEGSKILSPIVNFIPSNSRVLISQESPRLSRLDELSSFHYESMSSQPQMTPVELGINLSNNFKHVKSAEQPSLLNALHYDNVMAINLGSTTNHTIASENMLNPAMMPRDNMLNLATMPRDNILKGFSRYI